MKLSPYSSLVLATLITHAQAAPAPQADGLCADTSFADAEGVCHVPEALIRREPGNPVVCPEQSTVVVTSTKTSTLHSPTTITITPTKTLIASVTSTNTVVSTSFTIDISYLTIVAETVPGITVIASTETQQSTTTLEADTSTITVEITATASAPNPTYTLIGTESPAKLKRGTCPGPTTKTSTVLAYYTAISTRYFTERATATTTSTLTIVVVQNAIQTALASATNTIDVTSTLDPTSITTTTQTISTAYTTPVTTTTVTRTTTPPGITATYSLSYSYPSGISANLYRPFGYLPPEVTTKSDAFVQCAAKCAGYGTDCIDWFVVVGNVQNAPRWYCGYWITTAPYSPARNNYNNPGRTDFNVFHHAN